jgi:hypothetical protein
MPPRSEPPPGTVPVRLTIRPGETAYVPEDEVPILRQQGLLVEDDQAPAAGAEIKAPKSAGKDT